MLKMMAKSSILMVFMTIITVITSLMLPSAVMVRNSRMTRYLMMNKEGFDTIVQVSSFYECPCALAHDAEVSLRDYMRLPVDQYVCIKMPLDATLTRVENSKVENRFDLVVPPVRFFNLDVSPNIKCVVGQTNDSVVIESKECVLSGSPFVESLNSKFHINIRTVFKWTDQPTKKSITSSSKIYVEVNPPAPFKYFGKTILEKTGTLAMSIALRQIENAFVQSLAKDYEKWVSDREYRENRICEPRSSKKESNPPPIMTKTDTSAVVVPILPPSPSLASPPPSPPVEVVPEATRSREISMEETFDSPFSLSDDVCLIPGEPIVRIEEAPMNSRRIFTGIDILAKVDDIWAVLTDYENLQNVVPSLVKNEVIERKPNGGAILLQVGGAKVLPGITFTAKTVLDVNIYPESNPIPDSMIGSIPKRTPGISVGIGAPLMRNVFPRPYALTKLPHRDITMQNVLGKGDFDHYQGIWRIQPLPNCAPNGGDAARLTYAVEIRPKGFLPVKLIEGRIAADLINNLQALRSYVEGKRVPIKRVTPVEDEKIVNPTGSMIDTVVGAIRSNSDEDLTTQNRELRQRIKDLELELLAKDELIAQIETLLKKI